MSPAINFCSHSCVFCWRPIEYNLGVNFRTKDQPKDIIDGCLKSHKKELQGFWGNPKANKKKLKEAQKAKHIAISLSGEPTFYPNLPELIDEIKKRKMTAFLVTNGTNPSMLKKLVKHQPTQLYITLPAPDEKTYLHCCSPLIKTGWKKIMESLKLLKEFKRSTIRLTLVKGENMIHPEKYAKLIMKANPKFVEVKGYMFVGTSRKRLELKNMPLHSEIKKFASEIAAHSDYKIVDEKKESRVVLMMKEDKGMKLFH
jgi:tRNA wybutosine-synthesizing protein 1